MASTAMTFSIHQERWHDVWVAATAAVKSRKKHQVDFSIHRRIEELLQEFGPQSDSPLTLRVYGTMFKGFCVLNNERARLLYTDCERVVLMFAQRPFLEEGNNIERKAKRQRTDALALDLDSSKVQESDMLSWSQAPLEDGALLQLHSDNPLTLPDSLALSQPSLLDDNRLLDESFPPIDMQAIVPLDAAAEALRMAEAAAAAAAAPESQASAPLPFPPVKEVAKVQELSTTAQPAAQSLEELIANAAGDPDNFFAIAPPEDQAELELQVQKRGPRLPPPLPGPGHVYGFDEATELTAMQCDEWQLGFHDIGGIEREPAEFVQELIEQMPEPERLGKLQPVLDPLSDAAAIHRMIAGTTPGGATDEGHLTLTAGTQGSACLVQDGSMPEVQALLADSNERFAGCDDDVPAGSVAISDELPLTSSSDPFRPYVPSAPLASFQGADMELAGLLGAQGKAVESSIPDCEESREDVETKYDEQTAQVGSLLRRYMERTGNESRKVTLDDLIPPSTTDKDVAARTFLAVLTLATAGDVRVEQMQAYGSIAVSVL